MERGIGRAWCRAFRAELMPDFGAGAGRIYTAIASGRGHRKVLRRRIVRGPGCCCLTLAVDGGVPVRGVLTFVFTFYTHQAEQIVLVE